MLLGFKLIHVASVIVFLGNITTGVFWKAHADRTKDPRIIAHTLEGIIRADRLFTNPPLLLLVIGGVGAAIAGQYPILRTGWILWSIILLTISGFAFGTKVAPLQRAMLATARAGAEGGTMDWTRYGALSHGWAIWGAIALATPAIAVVLMIVKPILPGIAR